MIHYNINDFPGLGQGFLKAMKNFSFEGSFKKNCSLLSAQHKFQWTAKLTGIRTQYLLDYASIMSAVPSVGAS